MTPEEFRERFGEDVETALPYSINPAALRKLIGDEAWRSVSTDIVEQLPPAIVAMITERHVAQMICASMRGALTAYLLATFPHDLLGE